MLRARELALNLFERYARKSIFVLGVNLKMTSELGKHRKIILLGNNIGGSVSILSSTQICDAVIATTHV